MYDLIIRGGMVYDGTGAAPIRADVAVTNGVVTAVGDARGCAAQMVLNADGLAVAPGFIDAHAHSDLCFLRSSSCASKLFQGVTTEISGNCGDSPFPCLTEKLDQNEPWRCASFADFTEKFERSHYSMATNQAMLVGHGSLRSGVMGCENRAPTEKEMEAMQRLLRRDLEDGAFGMSLGLEYAPGFFAKAPELTALARIVAEYGGLVPCHMRSEGLHIEEALRELIGIGRESGAHVHVSHLKIDNYRVHGQAQRVWAAIENARQNGVAVTADLYPYTASSTTLTIRCPDWSLEGGDESIVRHLQGSRRGEIIESLRFHYFNAERADTCLFSDDGGHWPEIVGKTLREVAESLLHTDDYAEATAQVLLRTKGHAWCVFFVMNEQDMLYFLRQDTGIGSDGRSLSGDPNQVQGQPHPRNYGAIAEFFRLNRAHHFCSLADAVRRVTSLLAGFLGLRDRGQLKPGFAADITVFDPDAIAPRATYRHPIQLAQGVHHVIVNGKIALKDGAQTDLRPGQFLRKKR